MNYKKRSSSICVYLRSSAVSLFLLAGCNGPNRANIEVRKQNQDLQAKIEKLESDRKADKASIAALEQSKGTIPTLPNDRLENLFTVHDLRIGRLSGGVNEQKQPGPDDRLKIYVVPIDDSGDALKAAGSFVVEAYDLKETNSPLVGKWEFSTDEARKNWFGHAMLYEFVLTCPLSKTPSHDELTVHVNFVDELTGRRFEAQKIVRINRT